MKKIKTLYYDIIDVSEGININKKEYDICHYLSLKGLSFNSKSVMCVIVY